MMIRSFFKALRRLVQRLHTLLAWFMVAWFVGEWVYNDRVADHVVGGMNLAGLDTSKYVRGVLPVSDAYIPDVVIGLLVVLFCVWISHRIFFYLLGSFVKDQPDSES